MRCYGFLVATFTIQHAACPPNHTGLSTFNPLDTFKSRLTGSEMIPNEPIMWSTMNYSRNNETLNRLPVPDLRGWNGKRVGNLALTTWNELPAEVKGEPDRKKAMSKIKKLCR